MVKDLDKKLKRIARRQATAHARYKMTTALAELEKEFDLTIIEVLQLLLEFQQSWLKSLQEQEEGEENGGE